MGCGSGSLLSLLALPAYHLDPFPPLFGSFNPLTTPTSTLQAKLDVLRSLPPLKPREQELHLKKLIGVDMSAEACAAAAENCARAGAGREDAVGNETRWEELEVGVWEGGVEIENEELKGLDAIVLTEVRFACTLPLMMCDAEPPVSHRSTSTSLPMPFPAFLRFFSPVRTLSLQHKLSPPAHLLRLHFYSLQASPDHYHNTQPLFRAVLRFTILPARSSLPPFRRRPRTLRRFTPPPRPDRAHLPPLPRPNASLRIYLRRVPLLGSLPRFDHPRRRAVRPHFRRSGVAGGVLWERLTGRIQRSAGSVPAAERGGS